MSNHAFSQSSPFTTEWKVSSKADREYQVTIQNNTDKDIDLTQYKLWFNSNYHISNYEDAQWQIKDENGNLYSLQFKQQKKLSAGDSISFRYQTGHMITHTSMTPNGFYWQNAKDPKDFIAIESPIVETPAVPTTDQVTFLSSLYDKNARFQDPKQQLILPAPAQMIVNEGQLKLSETVNVYIASEFISPLRSPLEELAAKFPRLGVEFAPEEHANFSIVKVDGLATEEYRLTTNKEGVKIQASSPQGAFYALQSLKSLLSPEYLSGTLSSIDLPYVDVQDAPRFAYRGLMLDISRNFQTPEVLRKYIDIMASYKLNKLHLHFIDDEGWRLEIPSLPELTEIGAIRHPDFKEGQVLQPSYGSGATKIERQYLSKQDFIQLLRYAQERYITIIPELETPGHARAAVKSMEKRYRDFAAKGNKKEAERFLLHDFQDSSTYYSAQYWQDNVMNPAMPGTYRFIDHIIGEIKTMYQEAGLPFDKISIGGDELPNGAWEGSPEVQKLMKKEGYSSVHEVWPYYLKKVHEICAEHGVTMAGWEEIGMINKGKGMVVNDDLAPLGFQLDVWNNTIGGGQEDLAYRLANAGYKTVFLSATNYYFDMVWNSQFVEPGLNWASQTDLYHAYSLLPEAYFANLHLTERGQKIEKETFDSKVRLTEEGKKNLIGLKGALWSETITSPETIDYMIFPRFFALAQRAWSPASAIEKDNAFDPAVFDKEYNAFIHKVGSAELPKLSTLHLPVLYRLPGVGLKMQDGTLLANTEYPGFTIRYTTDGSTPTAESAMFPEEGISTTAGQTIRAASSAPDGRVGLSSTFTTTN